MRNLFLLKLFPSPDQMSELLVLVLRQTGIKLRTIDSEKIKKFVSRTQCKLEIWDGNRDHETSSKKGHFTTWLSKSD